MLDVLCTVLIVAWATYTAVRHCYEQGRFAPAILVLVGLNWWLGYALSFFIISFLSLLSTELFLHRFIGMASLPSAFLLGFPLLIAIFQTGKLFVRVYRSRQTSSVGTAVLQTIQYGPWVGVGNGLNFVVGAFWGMILTVVTQPNALSLGKHALMNIGLTVPLYGLWLGGFTFEAIGRSSHIRDCRNACLIAGIGALIAIGLTLRLLTNDFYPPATSLPTQELVTLTVPLAWAVAFVVAAITLDKLNKRAQD